MSLSNMRKKSASGLSDLSAKLEKLNQSTFKNDDENFWQPVVDKAGNGYAVIRFLPAPDGEDDPYIRYWDHSFQRNGQWYIEKSRTTLGEDDPVAAYNSELWATGEAGEEQVRGNPSKDLTGSKRRLYYVANILVIQDDKSRPENNGKVFKFRFGQKIFDKIKGAVQPKFPDQKPINPFCFWDGADFVLRISKEKGYRNYDQSSFNSPSSLFDGEEDALEAIWKQEYSLAEIIAPDKFKSYADLEKRLHKILGKGVASGSSAAAPKTAEERVERASTKAPAGNFMERKAEPAAKAKVDTDEVKAPWDTDEDDEGFFKSIE